MDKLGRFSRLVLMIQEAALAPERWNSVVSAITEAAGGSEAIFFSNALPPSMGGFWASRSILPDHMEAYSKYYYDKDVWRLARPDYFSMSGYVYRDVEIIHPETVHRSEFYNDFLHQFDIGRLLGAVVLPVENAIIKGGLYLSIFRPITKSGFDKAQQDLVEHLVPHLQAAVRTQYTLKVREHSHELNNAALNALETAVLVVDRKLRIVLANRSADQMLSSADGVSVQNGELSGTTAAESWRIRAFVASLFDLPSAAPRPHALRVERCSGRKPYACTGQRLPLGADLEGVGSDPVAILFIRELGAQRSPDPEALGQLYGLTAAEAQLASLLAQGVTLEQAASIRGIGYETARTYLKGLFEKTGCHRQAELVSLFSRGSRI